MDNYVQQLEEQNEQLQTKLAEAQTALAKRKRKEDMSNIGRGFKAIINCLNASHLVISILLAVAFALVIISLCIAGSMENQRIEMKKQNDINIDIIAMQQQAQHVTNDRLSKLTKQLKEANIAVEAPPKVAKHE